MAGDIQDGRPSYADRLRTNVKFDQRLKRNILEIVIEKNDEETEMILDQHVVARLMDSIKMNTAEEMEGFQIKYNRKGAVLQVWCKQGVDLEKFCRHESIQVGRGVFAKSIHPAGRRDVTVTVSGLNWNTPDSLVFEYIKKFGGQFVSEEVIYAKHGDGPLKGMKNGERKYQVIFNGAQMGTFHFLDGERVKIFYRGNLKTCGFCHKTADLCPGNGIAKDCKSNGGTKIDLAKHMRNVWEQIGFSPSLFELPETADEDTGDGDKNISQKDSFEQPISKPQLTDSDINKITGFEVRNIPASKTDEEVTAFLEGMFDEKLKCIEYTRVKNKLSARVEMGDKITGAKVLEAVNKVQFSTSKEKVFGNPLYCRILKDLTPSKESVETSEASVSNGSKPKLLRTPILSLGSVSSKRDLGQLSSPGSPEDKPLGKKTNLL